MKTTASPQYSSGTRVINIVDDNEAPATPSPIQYKLVDDYLVLAPEQVRVSRSTKDLFISLPGGDGYRPDVMIENYYPQPPANLLAGFSTETSTPAPTPMTAKTGLFNEEDGLPTSALGVDNDPPIVLGDNATVPAANAEAPAMTAATHVVGQHQSTAVLAQEMPSSATLTMDSTEPAATTISSPVASHHSGSASAAWLLLPLGFVGIGLAVSQNNKDDDDKDKHNDSDKTTGKAGNLVVQAETVATAATTDNANEAAENHPSKLPRLTLSDVLGDNSPNANAVVPANVEGVNPTASYTYASVSSGHGDWNLPTDNGAEIV